MKKKYRYTIRKVIPRLELPGGHVLPETYSEVEVNHVPFLSIPNFKPPGVVWMKIWDNWENKLIYQYPSEEK